LAPVLDFITRSGFLIVLALALSLLKSRLDLLRPVVKDALEISKHLLIRVLGGCDVLGIVLPLGVVGFELDVALDAL